MASVAGGAWMSYSGVPCYFYECQRATNVHFNRTLQTRPIQTGPNGLIHVWDDSTDLGSQPPAAFYRLRYVP